MINLEARNVGLFFAGVVTISGHVGLGLGLLGPLAVLPTAALGLAVLSFLFLLPGHNSGSEGLVAVVAALVICAPGFVLAGNHEYAADKVSSMFTIVVPLLIAVSFLARRPSDLDYYWRGIYFLASFGVLVAAFEVASGIDIGARGSDNASALNPIAAGRLGGTVVLWTAFGRVRWIPLPVKAGLILASLSVLLGAASRGPLLALLVALGVTGLGFRALRGKMLAAAVAAGAALAIGLGNVVLQESGDRILEGGDTGGSSSRSFLWGQAIDALKIWPEGIGWGQFSSEGSIGAEADYPHNFVLELALEAGVVAAVCFLLLWAAVARKLWFSMDRVGPQHFALLVFWTVTAMFSSDMNGNRVLLISLFGLFAAFRSENAERERDDDEINLNQPGSGRPGSISPTRTTELDRGRQPAAIN